MTFSRPKAPFRAAELWGGSILTLRQAHGRCHLNFLQQSAWPIWSLAIIECCTISDHGASFQFRLILWMGWRLALLARALIFRRSIDCCSPAITNSSLGLGGNTEEATHEDPTVELLLLDSIIQLNDPGWGNLDTRPSRRNYSSARISTTKPSNEEPRGVVFAPAAGFNTMATEAERDRDLFFARLALTVQRRYHTGKLCSPLPSRSCGNYRPASSTRQPFRNSYLPILDLTTGIFRAEFAHPVGQTA